MLSPKVVRLLRGFKNSIVEREVSRAVERVESARRPAAARTADSAAELRVVDYGSNNILRIDPAAMPSIRGVIVFKGNNNRIEIGKGCQAPSFHLELGWDASIIVEDDCDLSNLFAYCLIGGSIRIGAGTNFRRDVSLNAPEPSGIFIGKGCLFASQIDMSISDYHSVVSVETGARLNPPADIVIGDRVWIGTKATVLKGSHIGSGSIIGACAVVAGAVPKNCIAVGAPARVVRKGVTWRTELLPVQHREIAAQ